MSPVADNPVIVPDRKFQEEKKPGASEPPRIHCPLCGWSPRKEDKWFCTCGNEWNTFDIRSGMRLGEAARRGSVRIDRNRSARNLARVPVCHDASAPTFHQKDMEIRRRRLAGELAHHEGDLTSMVSGMVCHMLHQVRQSDLCGAEREHSL